MSGRTIYIIGGTTEGNRAARRLQQEGYRVVISVATPLGEDMAACGEIEVGRKNSAELASSAGESGAAAIVDCSHPFAGDVSREAARAADGLGIPLYRFSRPESPVDAQHVIRVNGWDEAVDWLKRRGVRALMTIGINKLELFTAAGIDFAARILPQPDSLARCLELGLEPHDIIAAQPPHDLDFNRACIRCAGAGLLVAKDSGEEGGLGDKIAASAAECIDMLLVSRPPGDDAMNDLDLLARRLREDLVNA